ncbi:MAG: hypothetical protein ACXACC_01455 [Promethearchaeota archaeon]|jgi:hypothetical protein
MVGTSPFIGAGQFGLKAYVYRKKYLYHTEKMLEILEASYNAGGRGIEVCVEGCIHTGKICEAARIMKETHDDYVVTGSTYPGSDPLIEDLIEIEANIIFVHASVSDRMNNNLKKLLDSISSRDIIAGIAVHNPISTLTFAFEKLKEINTFLIPFNANGFIMGNQKKLEALIDNKEECFFIGMKTLAAGGLDPSNAFNYISKHNICSVAIGMASVQEAEDSTKIALERLTKKKIT